MNTVISSVKITLNSGGPIKITNEVCRVKVKLLATDRSKFILAGYTKQSDAHPSYFRGSIPSGGRTTTGACLTSSQFVDSVVPPDSTNDLTIALRVSSVPSL